MFVCNYVQCLSILLSQSLATLSTVHWYKGAQIHTCTLVYCTLESSTVSDLANSFVEHTLGLKWPIIKYSSLVSNNANWYGLILDISKLQCHLLRCLNTLKDHAEDRLFSTAVSVNALINTWTTLDNGTLHWENGNDWIQLNSCYSQSSWTKNYMLMTSRTGIL